MPRAAELVSRFRGTPRLLTSRARTVSIRHTRPGSGRTRPRQLDCGSQVSRGRAGRLSGPSSSARLAGGRGFRPPSGASPRRVRFGGHSNGQACPTCPDTGARPVKPSGVRSAKAQQAPRRSFFVGQRVGQMSRWPWVTAWVMWSVSAWVTPWVKSQRNPTLTHDVAPRRDPRRAPSFRGVVTHVVPRGAALTKRPITPALVG